MASLRPLFSVMFLVGIVSVILSFINVSGQGASLSHWVITVSAREYRYVDINVERDTKVLIWAYIYPSGSDIDIAIIRPDGSLELVKTRYSNEFRYRFFATISGTYKILFDNSYSIFTSKTIDLAIVIDPPPHTVTNTVTKTETYIETYITTTSITYTTTLSPDLAMVYQLPSGQLAIIISVIIGFITGFLIAWIIKRR